MLISLKDNQVNNLTKWDEAVQKNEEPHAYEGEVKDALLSFDGLSLSDLSKKEFDVRKFLVFPFTAGEKDLADKDFIYSLVDKETKNPKFRTGNVMGFLGLGKNVHMCISSRFDDADKNFFLHYMLQKVCNIAYVPETNSGEDQFYDFLFYLFPNYLNQAIKQGIYRAYVTREYNDANVRGPIDINRHIRYNIPFNGKVAYHTREYTTDNNVTQLVRHTIEHIRSLPCGRAVLGGGIAGKTRDNVQAIEQVTESYNKNARNQIISKNLRRITHPYYIAYEPLRLLCLSILLHKKLSYGEDSKLIGGILFDGASLWEEYLATVIDKAKLGFVHSNNRLKQNGIRLFENGGTYYPDFYRRNQAIDQSIVLDAKYKRFANVSENDETDTFDNDTGFKVCMGRNDLFQMLAYIHCIPAKKAILLFPIENKNNQYETVLQSRPKKALGQGGQISAIGIPIPQNTASFKDFSEKMAGIEIKLIQELREY